MAKRKRTELPLELFTEQDMIQKLNLICVICRNVANDPIVTKCAHVFCKACVKQLSNTKSCPNCRSENPFQSLTLNTFVDRLIQNQTIKCPLTCEWKGYVSDLYEHTHKYCVFRLVTCLECLRQFPFKDSHMCPIKPPRIEQVRPRHGNPEEIITELFKKQTRWMIELLRGDKYEEIESLLDLGFDPNTTYEKYTILSLSVMAGRERVIYSLLSAHADPNMCNHDGTVAIHYASSNEKIFKMLLDFRADPYLDETSAMIIKLKENGTRAQI